VADHVRIDAGSLKPDEALDVLVSGPIEVLGLLPYSSNYVFLTRVGIEPDHTLAIYKPTKGERPLWDFPTGTLAGREVAAYLFSEAAGWGFVPPTVLRDDGPLGPGSLQVFVEHDPERHYFTLRDERLDDFKAFATFDVIVNNADRKAGHVLEDSTGRLWAVDHGLSFNVEHKLRTVIWDFAGDTVPGPQRDMVEAALARLRGDLRRSLRDYLDDEEIAAAAQRAEDLLNAGVFPQPVGERHVPWPLI
jgi:Phosphatidylinositol 3- and 4-kinase